VKRRGKSPPLDGQPARHEKPRVVQDKTGDARRLARLAKGRTISRKRELLRLSRTVSGY